MNANEFIDGFQFICVERKKDSLKKYRKGYTSAISINVFTAVIG